MPPSNSPAHPSHPHATPNTCNACTYRPKSDDGNSEYDDDAVCEFYTNLYNDLSVDQEENAELKEFFENNIPPKSNLIQMRANAFKVAVQFLQGSSRDKNVALLRCINVVLHNFELTCLW